jgi:hypothetical protein
MSALPCREIMTAPTPRATPSKKRKTPQDAEANKAFADYRW